MQGRRHVHSTQYTPFTARARRGFTLHSAIRFLSGVDVCRNVLNNRKGRNFTYTVSRACANIYRFGSSVLQLAGLRVVGGRLALYSFACCWLAYTCTAIINFLLNSSIIFCRTLVGSLPLANNVQHSASIHTSECMHCCERASAAVQSSYLHCPFGLAYICVYMQENTK